MIAIRCVGSWTLVSALALAGCSPAATDTQSSGDEAIGQTTQALTGDNGVWRNSLSTNGVWRNGLIQNGVWRNGLEENGVWRNGVWRNGVWRNGLEENGVWRNGVWRNGVWRNGLWENGYEENGVELNGVWRNGVWRNGIWSNGVWRNGLDENGVWRNSLAGEALRASPYARDLLKYLYACAMPGDFDPSIEPPNDDETIDPRTYAAIDPRTYNTTIDPFDTPVACIPGEDGAPPTCAESGYDCVEDKCVVKLEGSIGVAVNLDGSTWWEQTEEGAFCDESCQRWVTSCLLARTNAYGQKVNISLRAPEFDTVFNPELSEKARDTVKRALWVSPQERKDCPPGQPRDLTCGYTLREGGFYGNIFASTPLDDTPPEPGLLEEVEELGPVVNTPEFYACAGKGSNIPAVTKRFCSSQGDFGPIEVKDQCDVLCEGTSPPPDLDPEENPADFGKVYGCRGGCTRNESDTGWDCTKTYDEVITVYLKEPVAFCGNAVCEDGERMTDENPGCPSDCHPKTWGKKLADMQGATAVDANGNIVLALVTTVTVDLGSGPIPPIGTRAEVVVAKYDPMGNLAWPPRRFEAPNARGAGTAVTVGEDGSIMMASWGDGLWLARLSGEDGAPADGWPRNFGGGISINRENLNVAGDSAGNMIVRGDFLGVGTFTGLPQLTNSGTGQPRDTFVLKVSFDGNPQWVKNIGDAGSDIDHGDLLAVDPYDDIFLIHGIAEQNRLVKLSGATGALLTSADPALPTWPKSIAPAGRFTGVTTDAEGRVYATGSFNGDVAFGNVLHEDGNGDFFLAKYAADGITTDWVARARGVCPPEPSPCSGAFDGQSIGFDSSGAVVVGGIGGIPGGAVDFSAGSFSSGTFENYGTADIFVVGFDQMTGATKWAKHVPLVLNGVLENTITHQSTEDGDRVVVAGTFSGSSMVDNHFFVSDDPADDEFFQTFVASFAAPSLQDAEPPVVENLPLHMVMEATSAQGATGWFMPPTAIDAGWAGTNVVCDPKPNTLLPISPLVDGVLVPSVVTCRAYDSVGNSISRTFTILVKDTLPPVIGVPQELVLEVPNKLVRAVVNFFPTAQDQVDGPSTVDCSYDVGDTFGFGEHPVTCTSTDGHNNTATVQFTIKVVMPEDTEAPFPLPPVLPNSIDATGADGAIVNFEVPVTDDQEVVSVVCEPPSGSLFRIGDTPVSCTATDAAGNTADVDFIVTVADKGKPVLTLPVGPIVVPATSPLGAEVTYVATATDTVDDFVPVTCHLPSGSVFPIGESTVICSAEDEAGNEAIPGSFVVEVVDTGPMLELPDDITVEATSPEGALVTYEARATDAVDGALVPSCEQASGTTFGLGTTPVFCTVTDSKGTSAVGGFNVNVVDSTPPVLTLPDDIVVVATSAAGAVVTYAATAMDVVDGAIVPNCVLASGSLFELGKNTVTCTATDSDDNEVSESFDVHVQYAWSGVLQPIDADDSSIFKLGSTVTIKFDLSGASAAITDAVATLTLMKVSSAVTGDEVEAVSTSQASTGNQFRFDPVLGQYLFNLSTKNLSVGTWQLTIDLGDDVVRTVKFSLKK